MKHQPFYDIVYSHLTNYANGRFLKNNTDEGALALYEELLTEINKTNQRITLNNIEEIDKEAKSKGSEYCTFMSLYCYQIANN